MGSALAEKLKEVKIDYSAYGKLPIREDAYLIQPKTDDQEKRKEVFKQWEKLNYIRKNLKILDRYIKSESKDLLQDWLKKENSGMSPLVLEKIGAHNDATGGISAYFFNLQHFYDEQEVVYDQMEAKATIPGDFKAAVEELRKDREQKRNGRSKTRKLFMRDMKLDGKGYLNVKEEMPTPEEAEVFSATGEKTAVEPTIEAPKVEKESEQNKIVGDDVKKKSKKIGIYIAGTLIFITAFAVIASSTSETKNG